MHDISRNKNYQNISFTKSGNLHKKLSSIELKGFVVSYFQSITPDLWEINFAVKKRRKGKAPEGSGVTVGTEYHWYILAHQKVRKLDANTYTTSLSGLKYKLAHKRADKNAWNVTEKTQRKRLINLLKGIIDGIEHGTTDEPVNEENEAMMHSVVSYLEDEG